jgi:hypothetical protein
LPRTASIAARDAPTCRCRIDGPGLATTHSGSQASWPTDQSSRLWLGSGCNHSCTILFVRHVAAYLPGRVHRAVPPNQNR